MTNLRARLTGLAFVLLTCMTPADCFPRAPNARNVDSAQSEPASNSKSLELQQGYRPLIAALHVHTQFSNGDHSVIELVREAHERRIDVVGFTDSFLTRVHYGIGPLKKWVSRTMSRDGVADHGIEAYFKSMEDAQSQYPDVLPLPGVEIAPFYRWEGSYPNDLRLLDFNRHMLVFGLRDVSAIRNLPVIENETWKNTPRKWDQVLAPSSIALSGLILLFLGRGRKYKLACFVVRKRRRILYLGILLLSAGAAWLYDVYPFGKLSDPYCGHRDAAPYQAVVDYVRERNGLTFWCYPEARAANVAVARALMINTPNPEGLWQVDRYTGFEGLYGDRITITAPGGVWDRILLEYLRNDRMSWPSIITGIDFHYFKNHGWYSLDRGQTVLWARSKDEASVLDSLRWGRGYAVFQGGVPDLTLKDYGLRCGSVAAVSGETLVGSAPITLTAAIDWSEKGPDSDVGKGSLEIVRDGELLERGEQRFPIYVNRTEALSPGRHYYRVRVKYKAYEILSNPIFCVIR